jgi:hypothetical protein
MTEGYAHVDPGGNRQINAVLHRPPPGDIAARLSQLLLAANSRAARAVKDGPTGPKLSEPRSGIP